MKAVQGTEWEVSNKPSVVCLVGSIQRCRLVME